MPCGTCRHWGKPDEAGHEYRSCQAVVHDYDCLTTTNYLGESEDTIRELREFRRRHPAVVQDGSGYFAVLMSRTDFACSLFQEASNGE